MIYVREWQTLHFQCLNFSDFLFCFLCYWLVAQLCLVLCDPHESLPGFSVRGISQKKILEWNFASLHRCLLEVLCVCVCVSVCVCVCVCVMCKGWGNLSHDYYKQMKGRSLGLSSWSGGKLWHVTWYFLCCQNVGNMYGWFMLMFGRNQHNSVKKLSFN